MKTKDRKPIPKTKDRKPKKKKKKIDQTRPDQTKPNQTKPKTQTLKKTLPVKRDQRLRREQNQCLRSWSSFSRSVCQCLENEDRRHKIQK